MNIAIVVIVRISDFLFERAFLSQVVFLINHVAINTAAGGSS